MKNIKLLHCADIHLDMPFTSLGAEGDKSCLRRQELKDTLQKIIRLAKEEHVDLLLISGDLYEHDYVRRSTLHFISDEFKKIPDIRVFIIPGNHDPFLPDSGYRNFEWPANVTILAGNNSFAALEDAGVCVFGGDPALLPVNPSDINVLMVHGTVDMDFGRNTYNPLSSEKLETSGMDYIALGHFHNRLQGVGKGALVFNPGSPDPLGFDEEGEHGVFLVSITKSDNNERQTDVQFIPLNRRFYRNIFVAADGCCTDEQAVQRAVEGIEASGGMNDLYSITFRGALADGFRINTSRVETCLREKVFFVRIKDETIPDYDFEEIMKEPGLRGLFARKMRDRIREARDEKEKQLALQALYYGMEAIEQRELWL